MILIFDLPYCPRCSLCTVLVLVPPFLNEAFCINYSGGQGVFTKGRTRHAAVFTTRRTRHDGLFTMRRARHAAVFTMTRTCHAAVLTMRRKRHAAVFTKRRTRDTAVFTKRCTRHAIDIHMDLMVWVLTIRTSRSVCLVKKTDNCVVLQFLLRTWWSAQ